MRVELFAICWNDAAMLRFFFRHYDRFVARYVIFDDGSTDGSLELLRAHPHVELHRFERAHPDSFVISEQMLSNECWKNSRTSADWVIVTDIDEHLHHPDLPALLARYKSSGVSLVPALGYKMIADDFPGDDELLCETRTRGAPWAQMCKLSLFDPAALAQINYQLGRHQAEPEGRLLLPEHDEMLLLHYKYLGFERTYARHRQLLAGLGAADLAQGWGHKYGWSKAQLRRDWNIVAGNAVDICRGGSPADANYPPARWWTVYRKGPGIAEPAP